MITKILTYYHTLKYLKPIQWYGQIRFRLKKPKVILLPPPVVRTPTKIFVMGIEKEVDLIEINSILWLCLLNKERPITEKSCWNKSETEKLWLYHLHYFDLLHSKVDKRFQSHLVERWIIENPPAVGCGWEPYPLSLRIVNWIKWCLQGNAPFEQLLISLGNQIRYLMQQREYHLLGNHLLANAKALLYAGLFFENHESEKWWKVGAYLFNTQLKEQVLADGGHFELSTLYHCLVLEDLLDVINLYQAYQVPVPFTWLTICDKMFSWLETMSHPDQHISFFNDAALNAAPSLVKLQSYYHRLGYTQTFNEKSAIQSLSQSGYFRIEKGKAVLLADTAEIGARYQPGHAHADTLSFELSLGQQRVFVNSGTSTYCEGNLRSYQRSTEAHNTLVLNKKNSSHLWKSFRAGKRAHILKTSLKQSADLFELSASHDGYYAKNKIIHMRRWLMKHNELIIEDQLEGCGFHLIQIFFHCYPDIYLHQTLKKIILYNKLNDYLATVTATYPIKVMDSLFYPRFNQALSNKKMVIELDAFLPLVVRTVVQWSD